MFSKPKLSEFKTYTLFVLAVASFAACKLPLGETSTRDSEKNTLFLKFNPKPGSVYHYDVDNKAEISMEMNGKKTEKLSAFTVGMTYRINKDSSGNYLFETNYDKVHMESKNDEVESVYDAENASFSPNGTDKMLGALKESKLTVSVSPGREIKIVSGYEELSKKLMATLDTTNGYAKQVAQQKIDEIIKKGLIQRNVDQLFRFFPDSAMHIGSKWKMESKEQNDFTLNVSTFYTLNDIENGKAFINSKSTITSDKTPLAVMGYSVVPDLKGEQEGVYQVEASTCMLLNASITATVKGKLEMGGSAIPISIKLKVNIEGKKS